MNGVRSIFRKQSTVGLLEIIDAVLTTKTVSSSTIQWTHSWTAHCNHTQLRFRLGVANNFICLIVSIPHSYKAHCSLETTLRLAFTFAFAALAFAKDCCTKVLTKPFSLALALEPTISFDIPHKSTSLGQCAAGLALLHKRFL